MNDQKNLLLAIVASVAILSGYHYFFEAKPLVSIGTPQRSEALRSLDSMPESPVLTPLSREEALKKNPRIIINAPSLHGSLNLKGGAIDDLSLAKYHLTTDQTSPEVVLFSPQGTPHGYYADFGWASSDKTLDLPNENTLWKTDQKELTPHSPVTLQWRNKEGILFEKFIEVDDHYMFTITQKIHNDSASPKEFHAYGIIARQETPVTSGFFVLHEGPIGVFDNKLKEIEYKKLQDQSIVQQSSTGGWIGITDKYWLAALIPDQNIPVNTAFKYAPTVRGEGYQVDFLSSAYKVNPSEKISSVHRLFAGAKIVHLLDHYTTTLGIQKLDLAVDFGWFYFLTKPIFYVLDFFHKLLGNFGFAILLLTVLVKLLFFPLANKSYRSMAKMKQLQPELEKLQQKYSQDKMRLNQEMVAMYKTYKVNPLSGCLPVLLQFPVFFALYKVLFVSIEMRHSPFFGWVHDLSAADPTNIFTLFGTIPWSPPEFLMIGVWPLVMGVTMVLQQRLNPQPADPIQAKMFMVLPFMFTIMLARFPVGLVIYWAWSNILSIMQQWAIMRLEKPSVAKIK